MGFGKMNTMVDIISSCPTKDAEGFAVPGGTVLSSVRAYKEDKHSSERWANMAAFSTATALFRFRRVPGVEINSSMALMCNGSRYNILSVEDVRGRGMYWECLCEETEPSR
jgi:head-tail adaptor